MKKNQDPTERFAFHLITSRDIALNIASDGLCSEHVSFSIDKYLGNPKDGIHLSRRPDVVLASSGARGLTKFGLLVCKVSKYIRRFLIRINSFRYFWVKVMQLYLRKIMKNYLHNYIMIIIFVKFNHLIKNNVILIIY